MANFLRRSKKPDSHILSHEAKKSSAAPAAAKKAPFQYKKSIRIAAAVVASIFLLGGFASLAAGVYTGVMLNLIRYDLGGHDYSNVPVLPGDIDDGSVKTIIDPTAVDITDIETRGNTDTITNILLVGVDGRDGEGYGARSDTNIILSINTATHTIKLASLLRDIWVTVPGLDFNGDGEDDYNKLNAAFYYGGFDLLSRTIEQNFHLKIDQYIAVDFRAFSKAVDALGGVDVALSRAEAMFIPIESDDPDRFADNPDLSPLGYEAGTYHLNGQQALAYCRIRTLYDLSDLQRQQNQRIVIDKMMTKAKSANFATLTSVLTAVLPYVQTNISKQELLNYASCALQYADYTISTDYAVPTGNNDFENGWIGDGLGLWLIDHEYSVLELHRYLYADVDQTLSITAHTDSTSSESDDAYDSYDSEDSYDSYDSYSDYDDADYDYDDDDAYDVDYDADYDADDGDDGDDNYYDYDAYDADDGA